MHIPLAEKMRPETIEEVIGQEHIVGDDSLIKTILESDRPFSIIFWGPPGSGKTTLARILAKSIDAKFIELSAVNSGKKDVNKVVQDAEIDQRLGQRTILFIDEIHRFSKSQQDAFLPHVESGLISLIGATTENPSFEVITPLLSRSKVIVLKPIDKDSMAKIVKRAMKAYKIKASRLDSKTIDLITEIASGDARVALGIIEMSLELSKGKKINKEIIYKASQKRLPAYDKNGEKHYDTISAFIKSMRGSDANASLYYLARMLQSGEDPKFIARRMIIFASEDIGIAASPALNLAVSTFQAVERIGMPECQYNLFHCALVLTKADKSRVVTDAMDKANKAANEYGQLEVPIHIRNAPTGLMKSLGYGKDYKWKANFKHKEGFLPEEISELNLF